jgi:hypothetical protein
MRIAVGVSNYALKEMLPVYDALEKRGIPLASNQVTNSNTNASTNTNTNASTNIILTLSHRY